MNALNDMDVADYLNSIRQEYGNLKKKERDTYYFDKKWEIFIHRSYLLGPQAYGPLIEKRLLKSFHMKKSTGKGDAIGLVYDILEIDRLEERQFKEIKSSIIIGNNKTLNLLQIRLYQEVDYIYLAFDLRHNKYEERIYYLSHEEMESEVRLIGSFAHGDKLVNDENSKNEFSIHIAASDINNDFQRWNKQYKILKSLDEIDQCQILIQ